MHESEAEVLWNMSDSRIVGLPFQAIFVSPKVIIVDNNKQLNLKNITEFIIAKQIEHGKKNGWKYSNRIKI